MEEVPFGDFIIDKNDNEDTKNKTTFTGYDYMINFNRTYLDTNTYPVKLSKLFQNLCVQVGLEAGNIDFPNKDYLVLGNPFTNNESCKKVLSSIAQLAGGFAEIGRDNRVYIKNLSLEEPVEIIDGNIYYEDFEKNALFGTINTVVLGLKDVEGENVTKDNAEMKKLAGGRNLYNINKVSNKGTNVSISEDDWISVSYDNSQGSSIRFENFFTSFNDSIETNKKYYLVIEVAEANGWGFVNLCSGVNDNDKSQFNKLTAIQINSLHAGDIVIKELTSLENFKGNEKCLRSYFQFDQKNVGSCKIRLSLLEKKPNINKFIYESYIEQGTKELSIKEEYFMITDEERRKVIDGLADSLIGLKYLPFKTKYYGLPYLDRGDKIDVLDSDDTSYPSYIFNHNFKYNGAYSGNIETSKVSVVEEKIKNSTDLKTKFKNVELSVNKIDGKISAIVEEVSDYNEKFTSIEQDIDSITHKVENVAGITREVSGITKIQLEDCMQGQLLELHIYGNNTVFSGLYPSPVLYPSFTLYPFPQASKIRVYSEDLKYDKTIDLGIKDVLRQCEGVCDEYILKDNKAQIIRRIGVDNNNNKYILENEIIEDLGELVIDLQKGTNYIEILNYVANLKAKYVIINEFTTHFATTVEMHSLIQQLSQQIMLEVYKKIGKEEIIARINMAILGKDDADVPEDIEKSIIEILANKISIKSDNFELTKNGVIKAIAGTIAGLTMTKEQGSSYLFKNYKDSNNHEYQSGFRIPDASNGSEAFLYAGAPKNGYLKDSNLYIQHNGLIKAKWFSVNGEDGLFYVDFNSGRRALSFTQYGIDFKLDDTNNNNFCSLVRGSAGIFLHMRSCPKFTINDSLHGLYIAEFYSQDHSGNHAKIYLYRSTYYFGDGSNSGYEIATKNELCDENLKRNIKNTNKKALDRINRIEFKEFDWNEEKSDKEGHVDIGIIAQQVKEIDDNYVEEVAIIKNGQRNKYYAINTLNMLTTSMKAIQELSEENKQLRENQEKQQKQIDFLINKLNCKEEIKNYMEGEK